jgi:hypothetical protein
MSIFKEHRQQIEDGLQNILATAREIPHVEYLGEVESYIDVGEYGLALDVLASAFVDNASLPPGDLLRIFRELAVLMRLLDDPEYADTAKLLAGAASD